MKIYNIDLNDTFLPMREIIETHREKHFTIQEITKEKIQEAEDYFNAQLKALIPLKKLISNNEIKRNN